MAKGKPQGPAILTANDLRTGVIVFWDGSAWRRTLQNAIRAASDEERAALTEVGKAEEAKNLVVGAYLFEIDATTGVPVELREKQRLAGPSILLPTSLQTAA